MPFENTLNQSKKNKIKEKTV